VEVELTVESCLGQMGSRDAVSSPWLEKRGEGPKGKVPGGCYSSVAI